MLKRLVIYFFKKIKKIPKYVVLKGIPIIQCDDILWNSGVTLFRGCHLWGQGKIKLGNNVAIGKDTIVFSGECVSIGDNTMIAAQCYIIDSDHGTKLGTLMNQQKMESAGIVIGEDVWVGAGVKILKGVNVGKGSIIGAGAVVTKDIPPFEIWAGVPAKFIKKRE